MKTTLSFLTAFVLIFALHAMAANQRVLFLGNSYTYVNNLPQLVADVALSAGDSVYVDSYAPGGYTLQGHSTDPAALQKIASGPWDAVVLQEQSQRPSFPITQVAQDVFPYARALDSTIHAQWPCATTVFYMTWGRKNGDASNCSVWPPVCTYSGMDSLLRLRYLMMTDSNAAGVSPVGAVWNYLRQTQPTLELYQSDESHPSIAGSYAAACSFYAVLFRKDPTLVTYDAGLAATDAQVIRDAVKAVVFDSLPSWSIGRYDPVAHATSALTSPYMVSFYNSSLYAESYTWDFGDGNVSTDMDPVHTYSVSGLYTVSLLASRCSRTDTLTFTVNVVGATSVEPWASFESNGWTWGPNPMTEYGVLACHRSVKSFSVWLIDAWGRTVLHQSVSGSNKMVISRNQFSSGVYQLLIEEEEDRPVVGHRLVITSTF